MTLFPCTCCGSGIVVSVDTDFGEQTFDFAIWGHVGTSPTWLQRLKYCWRILLTGEPYGDAVILNKEEATRLAAFLSKDHSNAR